MNSTHVSRRRFLKTISAGAASAALTAPLMAGGIPRRRPNIIFIMADDHASHAMSCYGSRINSTPNLDRIAAAGMRFDNCFCTNSICAPSRAVILTGKYSHLNSVTDNGQRFDGGQNNFAKVLQKAGYKTAMIGKWHLKTPPTGFDYWNVLPGQGHYHNPVLVEMGEHKQHRGYVTDIVTDFALDWMKSQGDEQPFLLMCHHKAPHRNWQPDDAHRTMYDGHYLPEPETFNDDWATRSAAAREQTMTIEHHLTRNDVKGPWPEALTGQELKKWKYQRYIKDYLRCIASIDDNVGRILHWLDRSGLADDTIIVYTSDQGFFLGDHGWFDKRFMYEESLRMPLIVRYPRAVAHGTVSDAMVLNVDFAETFLDFAGAAVPSDMQGQSFRSILEGAPPADWRDAIYYHYYEFPASHMVKRHYGIRTERYKLMHFYHNIDAWEFYDLEEDPNEMNNLYDHPAQAGLIAVLKGRLGALQRKYGDTIAL